MKKTVISIIAALVCLVSANAQTIVRNYQISDFRSISASYLFSIEITCGDRYSVSVEAPNSFFDLIRVKKHENNLDFSLKAELPRRLRDLTDKIIVNITMPHLDGIELSGACKVKGFGVFKSRGDEFKAELSGASRITDLCIEAPKVDVEIDGASRAEINVNTGEVEAELSGASKLTLSGYTPKIELDLSGASAADTKVIECNNVSVDASGASRALVNAQKILKVELSGASKCEYIGPEELNLRIDSISGASTLKRLN